MNISCCICSICNVELIEKKDIIIFHHDKEYHKLCIMKEYEEQGWYSCSYCTDDLKDDFYLDTLICKKDCITVENISNNVSGMYNILYNNKIFHTSCFKKMKKEKEEKRS